MKRPAPTRKTVLIPRQETTRTYSVTRVRPAKTIERLQVEPVYVRFGEIVRDTRNTLGWTQADLAAKVGLVRASIANIEIGRQRILLDDVWRFAAALEVEPRKIFNILLKA